MQDISGRDQGMVVARVLWGYESYQSPWIVHESAGPVEGLVSQNWVCRIWPPGKLKQHVLSEAVVF